MNIRGFICALFGLHWFRVKFIYKDKRGREVFNMLKDVPAVYGQSCTA